MLSSSKQVESFPHISVISRIARRVSLLDTCKHIILNIGKNETNVLGVNSKENLIFFRGVKYTRSQHYGNIYAFIFSLFIKKIQNGN